MSVTSSAAAEAVDDVFAVLADPTRRRVLMQLSASGPATATTLAAEHTVSRQAVVQHLSALATAGLVSSERQGREVRYSVNPSPLSAAAAWLIDVGGQWDKRIAALRKTVTSHDVHLHDTHE